jgi:hypothetical protein
MMLETTLDLKRVNLFYEPPGTLRLTVDGDQSYLGVKLFQAWPLSRPERYLSIQNSKGEEIVMVDRLDDLRPGSRTTAEEELRRRYLTARVEGILDVRTEFGVTYWHVRTDKGERDFVVQSITESCIWLTDSHILIVDVDGCRFEITDRNALDPESQRQLESVL